MLFHMLSLLAKLKDHQPTPIDRRVVGTGGAICSPSSTDFLAYHLTLLPPGGQIIPPRFSSLPTALQWVVEFTLNVL